MIRARKFKARIVDVEDLSAEVRHFTCDVPEVEDFEFNAGQHLKITLSAGGQFEERYYSIASGPGYGNRFDLCLRLSDDKIGEAIGKMETGSWLQCFGPSGKFGVRPSARDSLFVGTGAGIAPLRSMIEHLIDQHEAAVQKADANGAEPPQPRNLCLIHGARTVDRLLYEGQFDTLAAEHPYFHFWPTVSRPSPDWEGRRGRVLSHLGDAVNGNAKDIDVYLCGRKDMIDMVSEELQEAGVDQNSIFIEK
jgi:CDP-4-dehydro-6-deoxyglucose reductase